MGVMSSHLANIEQSVTVLYLQLGVFSILKKTKGTSILPYLLFQKIGMGVYSLHMKTKTQRQKTGDVGEEIAVKFLVKHGFVVVEQNYWKKFGEIDIICRKRGKIHFVEVKTVSSRTTQGVAHGVGWGNVVLESSGTSIKSHASESVVRDETSDKYRAEDNIHPTKLKRIGRTIAVYLNEKDIKDDWEFHAIVVVLDITRKIARVRFLRDLII